MALHANMSEQFDIDWIDSGREPQCAPNPDYPAGIDLDYSQNLSPRCKAILPYPARRCGYYVVRCTRCATTAVVTTAGRPDDPRSITLPCELE